MSYCNKWTAIDVVQQMNTEPTMPLMDSHGGLVATAFRLVLILVAPLALLLSGCKSGAEAVVSDYFSAEKCTDREAFVVDPARWRERMRDYYSSEKTCSGKVSKIDATDCKDIAVGSGCMVTAGRPKPVCVLRTRKDEYRIDWPCSSGWNPVSFAAIADKKLIEPAILRVRASLSSSIRLRDGYSPAKYFTVELASDGWTLMTLSRRDTEPGQRLYSVIQNGKEEPYTVVLASHEDGQLEIVDSVRSWWSLPLAKEAELTFKAKAYPSLNACCQAIFERAYSGSSFDDELNAQLRLGTKECQALLTDVLAEKTKHDKVEEFLTRAHKSYSSRCWAR